MGGGGGWFGEMEVFIVRSGLHTSRCGALALGQMEDVYVGK